MLRFRFLTCFLVALLSTPALAATQQWVFENVVVGSNSAIVGGFTWDSTSGLYTDVAFTLEADASDFTGGVDGTFNDASDLSAAFLNLYSFSAGGTYEVGIVFDTPLTPISLPGTLININTGVVNGPVDGCTQSCGYDVSGGIRAVPLPAAAWLFGSSLVGLMGWQRKQRRQT